MPTRYSIEEADLALAAPVIQNLWVTNLAGHGADSAQTKLYCGYVANPAGRGTVILLKTGELDAAQGAHGLCPRSFHYGQRPIRAMGLADYVVNAEHRTLGPALMLLRFANQLGAERFDLTYGLPNAKAAPVFSRAGLKCLGVVRRYAKPLGTRELLEHYVRARVAGPVASLIDGVLRLRDRAWSFGTGPHVVCEPVAWDDGVFDDLWNRRPASLLLAERSGRMLQWRFVTSARHEWMVCAARNDHGVAQGYVVWRRIAGFVKVGDFFTTNPSALTKPLILAFARHARRAGIQTISVEFFGSSAVADQLRGAGMVLRPQQVPVFAGTHTSAEFESPEIWYLTNFDNDED